MSFGSIQNKKINTLQEKKLLLRTKSNQKKLLRVISNVLSCEE